MDSGSAITGHGGGTPDNRGHVVRDERRCMACDYSLVGLSDEGQCPECGTPVLRSVRGSPGGGADHIVREERLCIACGYSIVGLPTDGQCPECGTPVERSLRGELLHHANPDFLKKLARGTALVRWGVILACTALLGIVVVIVASFGDTLYFAGELMRAAISALVIGSVLAAIASTVVSAIGWWLVTTLDPSLPPTGRAEALRRRVRWYFVGWVGLLVVLMTVSFSRSLIGPLLPGTDWWLAPAINLASAVLMLLWFVAAMRYVRTIGHRIPDPVIGTRSRWCAGWAIALAAFQIVFVVGSIIQMAIMRPTMAANRAAIVAYQAQLQAAQAAGQRPPPPPALIGATTSMPATALMVGCGFGIMLLLSLILFIAYAMLTARLRWQCRLALERSQTG